MAAVIEQRWSPSR